MKSRISIDFTENWDVMEPIIRINLESSSDPKDKMLSKLINPKYDYLELVPGDHMNENEYFLRKSTNLTKLRLMVEEIFNAYKQNSEYNLSKLYYGMCAEYFYFEYGLENEVQPEYLYTKDLIELNIIELVKVVTEAINKELDSIINIPLKANQVELSLGNGNIQ